MASSPNENLGSGLVDDFLGEFTTIRGLKFFIEEG